MLYVVSFFLVAIKVNFPGFTMRGYECANDELLAPWDANTTFDGRFDFLSTLISGWINPVFLITAIFVSLDRPRRLIAVMRIVLILMIPFCWIVFHYEGVYPREGHFIWILGMSLVLFSREATRGLGA